MARYLTLWRRNPVAPWPTDPAEWQKLTETMWAGIDDLIKKGQIEEFGFFLNGTSGYVISEGEAADSYRNVSMFLPYIECEVHETISYEKAKESLKTLWKALAEAPKK